MNSNLFKILGSFLILIVIIVFASFAALKDFSHGGDNMKKADIEKIVSEYIKNHPQEIIDSVTALQRGSAAADEQKSQETIKNQLSAIENDPASPVAGNPNGDVTVVEFFDYSCGYCKRVFPSIIKLLGEDKNLKLVLKEFPILGPGSELGSRAALAVHMTQPDKYFEFHKKLMGLQRITGQESINAAAKEVGINVAQMEEKMKSPEIDKIIDSDKELAAKIGVHGTPAFIIGGQFVPGAIDYDTFKALIAKARADKRK